MENPFRLKSISNGKSKPYSGPNTRQGPRFSISEVPSVKGVSSSSGTEMGVVNISREGVFLETEVRLPPGTKINLTVVTIEGAIELTGHIVRSSISFLKGTPHYHSAVAFDSPLHVLNDLSDKKAGGVQPSVPQSVSSGTSHTGGERSLPIPVQDGALSEMLKLNDW